MTPSSPVPIQPPIAGVEVVPVRTPTLPPATHTNTWILGVGEMLVADPASPWEDEQQALFHHLQRRIDGGERIRTLFLTHHHHDHVAGALDLQARLAAIGHPVPITAHPITADLVDFPIDQLWHEADVHHVGGLSFDVLHTPGHAPGHLVLHLHDSGVMLAGDMVAGVGTIAIDPDEGDLGDYLLHLERMRQRKPTALLPAHGPVLREADAVLSFYIAHRHGRTQQIREVLDHGDATPLDIAAVVYPELDPAWQRLASRQVVTHLNWLHKHGYARPNAEGTWRRE
jgi:endoribonuclease LACTB2